MIVRQINQEEVLSKIRAFEFDDIYCIDIKRQEIWNIQDMTIDEFSNVLEEPTKYLAFIEVMDEEE